MTRSHPREERGQAGEGFVPYDAEFAGDRLSRLKRAWSNHVMPDEADHVWLLRMATKGVDALAASAAAPVTGTEGERSWLPMKDAPTGVPIIAKHKPNARMPLGWVGTIALGHGDEEEPGALDTILHYNGDALIWNFHGCWEGWLPFGSAVPAAAPQPAGAERVDLERLFRFAAAERAAYDAGGGRFAVMMAAENKFDRAAADYVRKLLTVPASLSASLGRGEGRAGATPMGSGSRPSDQAASHPAPAGFDPSRGWQPITTAPMTTDPILITGWAFADDDWNSGYVGYWRDAPAHKAKERYQCIGYMVQPASGHRCVGHRNGPVNVTHWMPLPPAPCDGSGEAGETHSGSTEGDSAVGVAEAPHPQSPSLSEVEEAPTPDPRKEALAVLEGLVDSLRRRSKDATSSAAMGQLLDLADAIEATLATLTASQEQDGEVRS